MKLGAIFGILLAPMLLAGGTSQPSSTVQLVRDVQSAGILFGTVTKGPLFPVVRRGAPWQPSGVAGAHIDIAIIDGDSSGTFKVNLPSGTYKVTMPSLYGAMFTKDLPATVTITDGQQSRLDIHLDTGIR